MKNLKELEDQDEDSNEFSTVYGDLMSFIMMLFLMLYMLVSSTAADSSAVKEKLQEIQENLNKNKTTQTTQPKTIDEKELAEITKSKNQKEVLIEEIKEMVKQENLEKSIIVKDAKYKILITMQQSILFPSGKARIKSKYRHILKKIGLILVNIDNKIIVEGHTDNIPIHNKEFDSNWELSFKRAYNVVKEITKIKRLKAARFSIQGHGEYKPIANNSTKIGRTKNRRIEISILLDNEDESKNIKAKKILDTYNAN